VHNVSPLSCPTMHMTVRAPQKWLPKRYKRTPQRAQPACAGAEDMRSAMAGLRGGEAAGMQHLLGFLYGCGERDGHRSAAAHGRPPAGGGAAAAHSGAGSPAWQPPTAVAPVDGRGCAPPGEGFREPRLAAGAQRDPGTIGQGRGCGPAPPIEGFREARMTASTARGASAKLSAYLALGALSPRQVHAALAAHQGRAAGGDRHTGPDGAGPGGACGRGGEGAAPGDEGPSVSAGVRRGRTANPEGSANEAGVGHGAGASRALVDRGASTDARSARREGRDRDSHEAEVGAGAEPGPAPDAPSGAATLAMHLQIRCRGHVYWGLLACWRLIVLPITPFQRAGHVLGSSGQHGRCSGQAATNAQAVTRIDGPSLLGTLLRMSSSLLRSASRWLVHSMLSRSRALQQPGGRLSS
jgi:hypothetical protein